MSSPGRPTEPALVTRLRKRRADYRGWPRPYRLAWVAAGFLVVAAGVAMLALPGPAVVVIPVGLAMLSFEFAWAERLLERALRRGADAQARASRSTGRERVLAGVAAACAVAAVALAAYLVIT